MRIQRTNIRPMKEFKPTKFKCAWEGCEKEYVKFKSTDKFCPSHRYQSIKLNKKVAQSSNKRVNKPIKQISDKRAIQLREYNKLRKEFLKDNPRCEIYPYLKSVEVHHKTPGADRSRNFLNVKTWMAVSREGHNFIHNNVTLSKERGWLK